MQLKAEDRGFYKENVLQNKITARSLLTAENLSALGIFAQDTSKEIHVAREGTWEHGV